MTLSWNAEGDFDSVVDTLEPINLYRGGRSGGPTAALAWRFREERAPAVEDATAIVRVDTTWQTPVVSDEPAPAPGDVLVDLKGDCWTIRSAAKLRGETRYRCEARRLEFACRVGRFDLQEPVFESGAGGDELVGWRVKRPAVRALAKPDPEGVMRFYFLEDPGAAVGDRLVSEAGDAHAITAVSPPATLGDPHIAEAA